MGEKTRELDVVLTLEELDEKKRLLPLRVVDVKETREGFKAVSKQWNDKIKLHEKDAFSLAECIKAGRERRLVPVFERTNETLFRIETVREDTNEVIDVRAMEIHEIESTRQSRLPFLDSDDDSDDSAGEDQRVETDTLPKHEALDTIHAPARTMACPGPDAGTGCDGTDCSRCLGQCVIPVDIRDTTAPSSTEDAEEDDPGTLIERPEAILGASATAASARKDH